MTGLQAAIGGADAAASGTVRLTAVPILVNRLLLPALSALSARHPGLRLELVAEPRGLSLTQRETDIALRLARPEAAGAAVLARRVGMLRYAAYAPAGCTAAQAAALPWIGYEDGMAALPQARWLAARRPAAAVALNDAESILHAVKCGLGRSLLPCAVADREGALRRLDPADLPPVPVREVWRLVHPDQRRLARIAAVLDWLDRTLAAAGIGR